VIALERPEGVCLPAGECKRSDQKTPRPVPVGVPADLAFEQRDGICRPPGRDELISEVVDGSAVDLGQPGDLAAGPVLTLELLESSSAPHTDRPLEGRNAVTRTGCSCDLIAEEHRVDWTGERVSVGTGHQGIRAEHRTKPRHRSPQRPRSDFEHVGEPISAQPLWRM
jgi:hypothetical protein